jgi:hypothetical protein
MPFNDDLNLGGGTGEGGKGFVDDAGLTKKEPGWGETLWRSAKTALGPDVGRALGGAVQAIEEINPNTPVTASNRLFQVITDPLRRIGLEEVPDYFGRQADAYSKAHPTLENVSIAAAERALGIKEPFGKRLGGYYSKMAEEMQPQNLKRGSAKAQVSGATRSLTQNVANMAIGFATGNPALALGLMSVQSGATDYLEKRAAGVSPDKAVAAGVINAATEYGTEKLPLGFAMKKGMSYGKRLLKSSASDIPGELLATMIEQGVIDPATVAPNKTGAEFGEDLWDTLIQTALVQVPFAGAGHAGAKYGERRLGGAATTAPEADQAATARAETVTATTLAGVRAGVETGAITKDDVTRMRGKAQAEYGADHPIVKGLLDYEAELAVPPGVTEGMAAVTAVEKPTSPTFTPKRGFPKRATVARGFERRACRAGSPRARRYRRALKGSSRKRTSRTGLKHGVRTSRRREDSAEGR